MKFTRIKTTMMAGMLAASMILPGMTALAAEPTKADATKFITKTVTAPTSGVSVNETFKYTFTQEEKKDDSGVEANTTTAAIPEIQVNATAANTAFNGVIDLSRLTTPGVYTYIVKETDESEDKTSGTVTWEYDTTEYRLRVYVQGTGADQTKTMTLIKTADDASDTTTNDKKVATAAFNNHKAVVSDGTTNLFKISKTVVDPSNMEPANYEYTFTVTITTDSANAKYEPADGEYTYKIGETTGKVKSGETIKLKKGETAIFTNIPAGDKVTVVETKDTNMASVATKTLDNTKRTEVSGSDYTVSDVLVSDDGQSYVSFENTWSSVTITGVVTNIAPYITLVAFAVVAIAAYVAMKNKVAR